MGRRLIPNLVGDAPASPVTLADLKAQLQIETTDYDTRLTGLLAAATRQVERFLGRALITRQYIGNMDFWPHAREGYNYAAEWPTTLGAAGGYGCLASFFELPMPPLVSVDLIATYDDTDVATTFDPSQYFVDTTSLVGRVVLRDGACWPIPTRTANGVEVTWTCGVGPELRPFLDDDIRVAILIAAGALNEHRGDAPAPDLLPGPARDLLCPERADWL